MILLGFPIFLYLMICVGILLTVAARIKDSPARSRFVRLTCMWTLVGALAALLGVAGSYVGQREANIISAFLFATLGPIPWVLWIAYFILRKLALAKAGEAMSMYTGDKDDLRRAAIAVSDHYDAMACGALLAMPLSAATFLLNFASIAELLGVKVISH